MKNYKSILLILGALISSNVTADEANSDIAFEETFMVRVGAYIVNSANSDVTVLSNVGIGAGINFRDDLGGETSTTIPRLDAYYRFNSKHRIDFTTFNIKRSGRKLLDVDLTIGDDTFVANNVIVSDIDYTLYKVGYAYSFYRSNKMEVALSAGLNYTKYDMNYSEENGGNVVIAGVSAPLPVYGIRMDYAITPNWRVRYIAESFFIELDDKLKGAILNYELDIEYKLFKHFSVGAGLSRLASDFSVSSSDWKGSLTDSNRGFILYGVTYF